jgi:hypothetical protein
MPEDRSQAPTPTAPKTVADAMTTAGRMAVVLLALGATFGLAWVALPILRAALLPVAPPGGWVLGPPLAFRFAACAVISACTLPFVLRPLGRRWRARDLAARGAPIDPLANAPGVRSARLVQGAILLVVYAIGGAFYFASHTEVLPDRIVIQTPLGARSYAYAQIAALEREAPVGGQPERYAMRFDDDRWGYFSTDAEGTTEAEIAAIAAHVSARAGLRWTDTERR